MCEAHWFSGLSLSLSLSLSLVGAERNTYLHSSHVIKAKKVALKIYPHEKRKKKS
jgi:hypothetical protein